MYLEQRLYIFILYLTPEFHKLSKDNCKTRRGSFKFWHLVRLILEILRYISSLVNWSVCTSVKDLQQQNSHGSSNLLWRTTICGNLKYKKYLLNLRTICNMWSAFVTGLLGCSDLVWKSREIESGILDTILKLIGKESKLPA